MNTTPIRFINAKLPTKDGPREASVTVHDGTIVCIDGPDESRCHEIDLRGAWLLPGAIDGHVHFNDPGFTYREDFSSGTRAAAAGGVTTVVDMPCTSLPPVTEGSSFDSKLSVIAPKAHVDFKLWGGVRGNAFDRNLLKRSLDELSCRGVRSVKTYLVSGMEAFADLTPDQLALVLEEAGRRGMRVGVHAEDKQGVLDGTAREQALACADHPLAYARSRSIETEAKGVATCLQLLEQQAVTGASLHIVHLACAQGVRLVREAKARGLHVTTETCPHYLAFTYDDLVRLGGLLKTAPVVKGATDREALWDGLADGTIDMIATDHAPGVYPEEKATGSIWTDYGGIPGVELLLSYVLSEGVGKGRISLARAVEVLCAAPARIHALKGKGCIEPGADADLVVFDPRPVWTVRAAELCTRQKYTPFDGVQLTGRVCATYVRGVQVFDINRGVMGAAEGRLVPHS